MSGAFVNRISFQKFVDFWEYYQGLPHQREALLRMYEQMPRVLLEETTDWISIYRDPPADEEHVPGAGLETVMGGDVDNSWGGVLAAARVAGAKFPQVVAAQWALESGWGKYISGKNNFFGIKGHPGTVKHTWEVFDGHRVEIDDVFST